MLGLRLRFTERKEPHIQHVIMDIRISRGYKEGSIAASNWRFLTAAMTLLCRKVRANAFTPPSGCSPIPIRPHSRTLFHFQLLCLLPQPKMISPSATAAARHPGVSCNTKWGGHARRWMKPTPAPSARSTLPLTRPKWTTSRCLSLVLNA